MRTALKNPLSRRKLLGLIGGAGVATFVGCGNDEETLGQGTPTKTAAATRTASATSTGTSTPVEPDATCDVIPEETAGPFPATGRTDRTSSPKAM